MDDFVKGKPMTPEIKAAADRVRRVNGDDDDLFSVYGNDDPSWMRSYLETLYQDDCELLAKAFIEEHQDG